MCIKLRGHSACRSLLLLLLPSLVFSFLAGCPQLLIDTHLSSAPRDVRTACEDEKVVIPLSGFFLASFSSSPSSAAYTSTRARACTPIRPADKDLVLHRRVELQKSKPLDNRTTSPHATRHTNHVRAPWNGNAADRRR